MSVASSSSRVAISSPVVVALDYDNRDKALAFVDRIDPRDCRLKVGKEMFTLFGPQFVRDLQQRGFEIFLDLKFHDIPNTTAHAVAAAADLGVWMVNVHASGGARMMTAAREALTAFGADAPLLIAVTVLTSMESSDLLDLGIALTPAEYALKLATTVAWTVSSAPHRKPYALSRSWGRHSNWSRRAFAQPAARQATSVVL